MTLTANLEQATDTASLSKWTVGSQ